MIRSATRTALAVAGILVSAAFSTGAASAAPQSAGTGVLRGIDGEKLGTKEQFDLAVGGAFSTASARQLGLSAVGPNVYAVTINRTSSGWSERFLLALPSAPPFPAPLLVLHHGYGQTPDQLLTLTTFVQEAQARGWYVLAPLAAHKFSFSIEYAQRNVEEALAWVARYFAIDIERIYGVGFSMGGGMTTAYAARHLDPLRPRFAALVNHTGSTSIQDVWWRANDRSLLESPLMFGGTPLQQAFAYVRASTIDLDPVTGAVDQDTDLARNIAHIPVRTFRVAFEPVGYLVDQCEAFHDQLTQRNGTSESLVGLGSVHSWSTLDETATLDWLAQFTLGEPGAGQLHRTIADRKGRWHAFSVDQHAASVLTPFDWFVDIARNRLYVAGARNLARLEYTPAQLGLTTGTPLEVVFGAADGLQVDIVLQGFTQAPLDVRRNDSSTAAWTWNPGKGTVTLHENATASYPRWRVIP